MQSKRALEVAAEAEKLGQSGTVVSPAEPQLWSGGPQARAPGGFGASGVVPRPTHEATMTSASTGELGVGTLIGNNIRLVRLLGQGGMGSVWVAQHLGLQTEVAVKFILADHAQHAEAVARFQREATNAAQLKSPHVVQVFDHGVTPHGTPYIVMELLEGEDLGKRIEQLGPLSLPEVALIVSQVCKALSKAHAQGIVHRDIKPDNIFLMDADGDLFIKVLDFGIAKRAQDAGLNMTSTGAMVGTPNFMSPEQVLSSKAVDFRADLWSVAVVAYNALTGALPFNAETLGALCVAISNGSFAPASGLRAGLPPAIDAWFERALNRDPAARFGSAREMSDALSAAAGLARPPTSSIAMSRPLHASTASTAAATPPPFASTGPHTLHGASASTSPSPRNNRMLMALLAAGGAALVVLAIGIAIFVKVRASSSPSAAAESALAATPSAPAPKVSPASRPSPTPTASQSAPTAAPKPASVPKPSAKTSPRPSERKPTTAKTPPTAPAPTQDRYGF